VGLVVVARCHGDVRPRPGTGREQGANAVDAREVLDRPVASVNKVRGRRLPIELSTGIGWARTGAAAYITDHVTRILGRPAGTFEQWAHDHRRAWVTAP